MTTIYSPLDLRQTLDMMRTITCLARVTPHSDCHGCRHSAVSTIGIMAMDGDAGSSCVFLACIQPDVVGAFVETMSEADRAEYKQLLKTGPIPLPCVKAHPVCNGEFSEKPGCDF